jgi:hypothetical protein
MMLGFDSRSIIQIYKDDPSFLLNDLILLFGLFATFMWYKKFKNKENYKMWFYFSTGGILFLFLVGIIQNPNFNWQIFLKNVHF